MADQVKHRESASLIPFSVIVSDFVDGSKEQIYNRSTINFNILFDGW